LASRVSRRTRFRLYLVTDRSLAGEPNLVAACDAILARVAREFGPGAVALQLREKDLPARDLYALARALRAVCTRAGATLLVNDRIDVAIAAAADGVHLPADSFAVEDARALLGPARLIGVSTHSLAELGRAARAGADFAVFGPVYHPISKDAYGPARGLDDLKAAVESVELPVYALGGITIARAGEVLRATDGRIAGVAAIGSVFGAESPADAACALIRALAAS
jgi:thiamine-phosphate pyrophosphorylase